MASTAYSRGTQTFTSFFRPMTRKSYHRKSTTDATRLDVEAAKDRGGVVGDSTTWVPHETTGIYHPKGQAKVIEDVPLRAAKDVGVNWHS
ncbi:hypothetical protein MLD38_031562 [Melastoma candidum]|uniref:Uncharacterized protein n=1 Tax=Melastoma candidum TaxID=119954 RepID=A0ACB9MS35_9MYRT|nr:hypothetical protein MLD38_031562 [Melastoma candidum]